MLSLRVKRFGYLSRIQSSNAGGPPMDKPTVFISYSHKDEIWKDRLVTQLRALELLGHIVIWEDRKIDAGEQWYPEIQEAMQRADIALCLISPNYLASKFC